MPFNKTEQQLLLLFGLFVFLVMLSNFQIINWTIPCAFQHFFSIECLGCGTTKAISLAFQGKFEESLHSNPLGLLLLGYSSFRVMQLFHYQIKKYENSRRIK